MKFFLYRQSVARMNSDELLKNIAKKKQGLAVKTKEGDNNITVSRPVRTYKVNVTNHTYIM